ncbi:FMN-binding protein [Gemmiger formicilis]|uniref:FMN-binding protein n=1 Tax=Gemmiger formicilis TaxID=745368 RepID=UPI0019561CBC|nr:FMN-binding protein [Gemmiger formicilis]MBM6916557.1 FMN-binding protein [Gemmiger formicilis]
MKRIISLTLAALVLLACTACGAQSGAGSSSAAQAETLTGKGTGFGGTITATLTVENGVITAAVFDGPDETAEIGGAALETLAEQVVAAGSAEIDGVAGATVTSEGCRAAVLNALGEDGVVTFTSGEEELSYAKYIRIGDIVWTGEVGSDPACEVAVVYSAEIDGQTVKMNDYVATEAGGEWFVNAAGTPAQLLASADAAEAAGTVEIPVKETNGHGVGFWPSPITFPGNIQAIKDFVTENGFDYDYYADGGMTQNEEGYWQTPDAVSGATLAETPTYLDMLKTLYERIQAGEYVAEN